MKSATDIVEECYEGWLTQLFNVFFSEAISEWSRAVAALKRGLALAKKCRDELESIVCGEALTLLVTQGDSTMRMKMAPSSKKAVMPSVNWSTLTAGIQFQLVDASGAPIGTIDPTTVATTLTAVDSSGNPSTLVTITPGADSLHYQISKAAGITGSIVLMATLTYLSGSPGPFSASLPIVLDVPAAADLQLVISGN
jgi:hypothetical protein